MADEVTQVNDGAEQATSVSGLNAPVQLAEPDPAWQQYHIALDDYHRQRSAREASLHVAVRMTGLTSAQAVLSAARTFEAYLLELPHPPRPE